MRQQAPTSGASVRLGRETFGLVLRAGRERRRVSLAQLSRETKVPAEVWRALEENDFSKWPAGIYARSMIRQYAERVDLDPEELVNEFCRLFPTGERRTSTVLREYAAIVAHRMDYEDDAAAPRRRLGERPLVPSWSEVVARRAPGLAIAGVDLAIVLATGRIVAALSGLPASTLIAGTALTYHAVGVLMTKRTPGAAIVDWMRRRIAVAPGQRGVGAWAPAREPAALD